MKTMEELVFEILLTIIEKTKLSLKSWKEFKDIVDKKYVDEIDTITIKKD